MFPISSSACMNDDKNNVRHIQIIFKSNYYGIQIMCLGRRIAQRYPHTICLKFLFLRLHVKAIDNVNNKPLHQTYFCF